VNWRVRDVELATAVKTAAKLLKKLSGRPVKITAALIARNIETGSKLGNQLHQLPRTREALKKVVETRLEFAERRLWWAVKCCRDENVSPSRSAFRRHTKILSSDWKDLLLKAATDEALRSVLTE
jgi:hypothetical protein